MCNLIIKVSPIKVNEKSKPITKGSEISEQIMPMLWKQWEPGHGGIGDAQCFPLPGPVQPLPFLIEEEVAGGSRIFFDICSFH